MIIKSKENLPALAHNTEKSTATASNINNDFVFDKVMFDTEVLSALQSVFNTSCQDNTEAEGFTKSASVKFMITIQDEANLRSLGYSKAQIDQFKPQEAADILQGTKAKPTAGQE